MKLLRCGLWVLDLEQMLRDLLKMESIKQSGQQRARRQEWSTERLAAEGKRARELAGRRQDETEFEDAEELEVDGRADVFWDADDGGEGPNFFDFDDGGDSSRGSKVLISEKDQQLQAKVAEGWELEELWVFFGQSNDSTTLSNPLAVGATYSLQWEFFCLNLTGRSRWDLMSLYCAVAHEQLKKAGGSKEAGMDAIADDVIRFLRRLAEGIPCRTVWGDRLVKGTLLVGMFDMPALSENAGTLDLSTALRCCLLCCFLKSFLQRPVTCGQYTQGVSVEDRWKEYEADVQTLQEMKAADRGLTALKSHATKTGVQRPSPWSQLYSFTGVHFLFLFIFDLMHITLEGVLRFHVFCILRWFVDQELLFVLSSKSNKRRGDIKGLDLNMWLQRVVYSRNLRGLHP
uniref:Uncharacterized protein n=1 Tax=Chromera velia CCMP2878 TaxID=1169474 RepID=A0A0G4FD84_9ALVE|eukprot:Cvel_16463.t1-p1 / transcript=Cvel_16463.t1 / gene=Cvel_16463 / organism=Chromera_velia_CCMP2878 / gene_product=hypothetical protein / transcript_product=hypothetical protein / location=Cvel_scaffold1269:14405-15802(+) / protein_length=401 / sequence_SO=supercontig / SO=protein_coding / is_pseudo=false